MLGRVSSHIGLNQQCSQKGVVGFWIGLLCCGLELGKLAGPAVTEFTRPSQDACKSSSLELERTLDTSLCNSVLARLLCCSAWSEECMCCCSAPSQKPYRNVGMSG